MKSGIQLLRCRKLGLSPRHLTKNMKYPTMCCLERIEKLSFRKSYVTALISMVHKWLYETDGTDWDVKVFLFDYRKAIDLIDHTILVNKLKELDIPTTIVNWIGFLSNRPQRVKLSQDCMFEWGEVSSGASQGTKLGPWFFILRWSLWHL